MQLNLSELTNKNAPVYLMLKKNWLDVAWLYLSIFVFVSAVCMKEFFVSLIFFFILFDSYYRYRAGRFLKYWHIQIQKPDQKLLDLYEVKDKDEIYYIGAYTEAEAKLLADFDKLPGRCHLIKKGPLLQFD